MNKKQIKFTPKARLIQILGEHLIKDATVGLIELVKNSYDADATKVEIIMDSLNTPNAKITIKDNGLGMSEEQFINNWMNPASGHKEMQKVEEKRTKLGRLPLGEKGVGRFAVQQIGNKLLMISKVHGNDNELNVEIDWKDFDNYNLDLSQIPINYSLDNHSKIIDRASGTTLEISDLKSAWSEDDIRRISTSLKRMKSPFKEIDNFEVFLNFENCPDSFLKYSDIEGSDLINKAHYTLYAIVDKKGELDFEYNFKLPGFKTNKKEGHLNLLLNTDINISEPILCGGFFVKLFAFDRKVSSLKSTDISRTSLRKMTGVSVYRDGIRIFPYGEEGNDWLNLDNRRIQNPGERIGNDQVIGLIEIDQKENSLLIDKTNREGLIENQAYHQFAIILIGIINILETEMMDDRRLVNPPKKQSDKNMDDVIQNVKKDIDKLVSKIKAENPEDSVRVKEELQTIFKMVDDIKKITKDEIEDIQHINDMLFNLAGTGLAAERFTHEFSRLVAGANASLDRLSGNVDMKVPHIKKEINTIRAALEALRNDIKLLGPMFYVKKVAQEKELNIYDIIKNTISLQEHFLDKEKIKHKILGDPFKVTMREGSCMQIFNNLIDNSIYWLSKKSETDKRTINLIMDSKNLCVYVSDSGPGIVQRYRDKIFDPFFSLKVEEGRGLGLYIVKEILEEKNMDIILVEKEDYPDLLNGASFKIIFKDKYE